jgi:RIO kinase 1
MPAENNLIGSLDSFIAEGSITHIVREVKSGKEATVYCCRGADGLVAAKVYRPLESRRFKNDAVYHTGRMHLARNGRVKRAAENKSAFGRKVQYATWIDHEWQTLSALFNAGADVPRPISRNENAILMMYLGDEQAAAPRLGDVDVEPTLASRIIDRLLWNIELMLDRHTIHGDLSPFNLLLWDGQVTIIDLPQAVDPRLNPAAQSLLSRDIHNICAWARKRGAGRPAHHPQSVVAVCRR